MVSLTESPIKSRGATPDVTRGGFRAGIWLGVIILLAWQILMVPRLLMDGGWLGGQASNSVLPIARLAVSIIGTIGYVAHLLLWLGVSVVSGSLLALAGLRRSREVGR